MRTGRGWAWVMFGLVLAGCGSAPQVGRAGPEEAAVVATQAGDASGGLLSAQALGPSGTLDPAYGEQGVGAISSSRAQLTRGLAQSDGQALLMGHAARGGRITSYLRRITAGGQPDSAFNAADTVSFPDTDAAAALLCPRGANRYNDWGAACEDPQRIVVASSDADTFALTLTRLLPSGQLDTSFGVQGRVAAAVSVGAVQALLIQSDGKLVVLGSEGLARFKRGGQLDPTFGLNGVNALPLTDGAYIQDIVMDSAERFLLLTNNDGGTAPVTQVVRLTQTGRLDPGYGAAGRVTLDFSGGNGQSLLVLNTGRLVVGGTSGLWRLLPSGTPDPTFGTAGHATFQAADGDEFIISGLAQDNQNRLVASVLTSERFKPTFQGNLARFRNNGTLDPNFASGGLAHVALCAGCAATGGLAEFNTVAVLRNGRLLGMGTSGHGNALITARVFP